MIYINHTEHILFSHCPPTFFSFFPISLSFVPLSTYLFSPFFPFLSHFFLCFIEGMTIDILTSLKSNLIHYLYKHLAMFMYLLVQMCLSGYTLKLIIFIKNYFYFTLPASGWLLRQDLSALL